MPPIYEKGAHMHERLTLGSTAHELGMFGEEVACSFLGERGYEILQRNHRRMCLCTGMLYDPAKEPPQKHSRLAPYVMFIRNQFKKLFHLK